MSLHSFPKIDQKEYLKKYLSGDKVKKKKKDKKYKKSTSTVKVKVIDDDINNLESGPEIDEELLLAGDDAPQIVGEYIEEGPTEKNVPKWKSIVVKDEPEDDSYTAKPNESDLWGRKSDVRVKKEYDMDKRYANKTSSGSPSRRKDRKHQTALSPPTSSSNSTIRATKAESYKSPLRYRQNTQSPERMPHIKTEHQSPPHKKHGRNSIHRQNRSESSDISPPRRRHFEQSSPGKGKSTIKSNRKYSAENFSPPRRRNSDQSPPRKCKSPTRSRNHFPNQSPPRHIRNSSPSPPRRKRGEYSPLERHKSPIKNDSRKSFQSNHRRNSDQSPPRRRKTEHWRKSPIRNGRKKSPQSPNNRGNASDQSPPRRTKRFSKSPIQHRRKYSGESPSRGYRQKRQTPDNSHRKIRKSSDQSPPRKRRNLDQLPQKHRNSPKYRSRTPDRSPSGWKKSVRESSRNSSPARAKREKGTPDLSPQERHTRWKKQESHNNDSPPPTHKPKPIRTLEGKISGLQDAKALKQEITERRKQEDLLFKNMSADISGRTAEVQVRSTGRKGHRAREASEEDPEKRRRKEEHEEKKKLLYDRWGKGLKQIEDHKKRIMEQEYESSKPLARYSNDEDLERHLKEQERSEDPMLEYMRQKRKEKEKQSGKPQIPRYEGPYPENRFGIRPGYRWDGVDRSNGYEKKYFAVQNEKRARQDEAYKYSVEDM